MATNPPDKNFVMRDPLRVRAVGDAVQDRMTRTWPQIHMALYDGTPNPSELEVIVEKRLVELESIRADAERAIDDMKKRYAMPPEMTDDRITMDWMVITVKEIWRGSDYELWSYLCMPREPIEWLGDYVKGGMSADEQRVVHFIGCYIAHYQPDMLANIHTRRKIINAIKDEAKNPVSKADIIRVLDLKAANGMEIHYLMRHLASLRHWIRVNEARMAVIDADAHRNKKAKTK